MKILLTGATGFVPSNMVLHFSAAGHQVVAFDLHPPAERLTRDLGAGGRARVTFLQGDVRDEATSNALIAEHRPTHVVHAAAMTPNREMERERPRQIVEVNQLSSISLLQAAARANVERFIYFSSMAVYDGTTSPGQTVDEDAPLHTGDRLYALTKVATERLCHWAHAHYGLDVRIIRPGSVYGPYERPTPARPTMSAAYNAVHQALAGRTLRCNAPEVRQQWIHARDIAKAVLLLLETRDLAHDTFNAAGEPVPMTRLLDAVAAAVPGTSVEWVASETDANVPVATGRSRATIDSGRLARDTGYQPAFSIESGIRDYADWLRAE